MIPYKGTLKFTDQQVALVLMGLSVTVMIGPPLWVRFGERFGKLRFLAFGSLALTALTAVVYRLMPPQSVGPVLLVVIGGLAASSVVLLESLFPDEDKARAEKRIQMLETEILRIDAHREALKGREEGKS